MPLCKYCNQEFSRPVIAIHEVRCNKNPANKSKTKKKPTAKKTTAKSTEMK